MAAEKPKSNRGGRREGSGRKTTEATELKRLAIENASHHAEESLQMLVDMRDACKKPADRELKKACCIEIMDRVWGKSKTRAEVGGPDGGSIPVSNPAVDKVIASMSPEDVLKLALGHVERNG